MNMAHIVPPTFVNGTECEGVFSRRKVPPPVILTEVTG